MNFLREKAEESPVWARVAPYVIIVVLTSFQDSMGDSGRYWLYLVKMIVGAWCIWQIRPFVPEMRWAFSWEAVVVGVLVCVIWVGLDPFYPHFGGKDATPWNPFKYYGEGSVMGFFFVAVRTLGSAIIVPPIEEICYRSFLYRWFVRLEFRALPLNHVHLLSFVVTSAIFGFVHSQWLAGILCGMAFQWLVIRKNRLGDAMLAHGITNFLLGIWIYWQGDWKFW